MPFLADNLKMCSPNQFVLMHLSYQLKNNQQGAALKVAEKGTEVSVDSH